ncbi:MAG: hypothetical protein WCX46_01685 [Candidatus Paceibacterota bacterium]
MSKRNIIISTIGLIIIVGIAYVFLVLYKPTSTLKTEEPGTNFLSNLFNFGKSTNTTPTETEPADISGYVLETEETPMEQRLMRVSSMPIAGFTVFMKERFVDLPIVVPTISETEETPIGQEGVEGGVQIKPTPPPTEFVPTLRYVDKATGNIYQTFANNINESQFTTTIVPKVYDAYFGNNGESVLMRYFNDSTKNIETFIGNLPKQLLGEDSTIDNEIKGSFLPENISNINISPDTTKLFYLFNLRNNEGSVGIVANANGDKKVQVFNSPFTDWVSFWPNSTMITLTTKPSSNLPGFMYISNPDQKNLNKILGNINGLTTLASPNGKLVLYSNNNLSLSLYNIETKEVSSLGIRSLPEKCVWGKVSDFVYCAVPKFIDRTGYPDIWYQGETSFTDEIWKINVIDNSTSLISDPINEIGEDIDGIKLMLDENGNSLFFVNKKNSYLWKLSL